MIIVTGAAGFIGSSLVSALNHEGFRDIVLVDDFSNVEKDKNLEGKIFSSKVDREVFIDWLKENHKLVQFIFHIGARTDTTEFDSKIFDKLNLNYSKDVWNSCVEFGLPLVYASSAATYGDGALGYMDFSGDLAFNVLIRTMLVKGRKVSFHVGSGIVADSKPQAEYEETLVKAQALKESLHYENANNLS